MEQLLRGQVAMVTGANRGIGRQIAFDLAAAGATVVQGARNLSSLAENTEKIEAGGGKCDGVRLDVTDQQSVQAAVDHTIEHYGRIDLLVNNAGIGNGAGHPWDLPIDDWWEVMEVNVKGVYLCTQAVMEHMTRQQSGRIIDVGSLAGTYPNPRGSSYSVSKAALFQWNACLAEGAKAFGVSVFVISPGLVATDMTDHPQFADVPDEDWVPIEKSGALVVALASGKADGLSGRFIHALDDLDDLIANVDEIEKEGYQRLGLRMFNSTLFG